MLFNIAKALQDAYIVVGSWGAGCVRSVLSMRIPLFLEQEIKKYVRDRHYYLKQAHISIKLKDISQMHIFCALAENKQKQIDEFARLYPTYELSQCIKRAF